VPPQPPTVHRPARTYLRAVPADAQGITVAAPPPPAATSATAWLSVLLPVAGSAGSAGFLLLLSGRRSVLAVALLAGTVLLSLGLGLAARRRERRARRGERDRYRAYLGTVRARLDELATAQRDAAEFLLPNPARLLALAGRPERLWERRPTDHDFLTVRLGRGPVLLACSVRLESGGPLADHDPGAPRRGRGPGRAGRRAGRGRPARPRRGRRRRRPQRARALVRALLCYLAVLHAPDDLRTLACIEGDRGPLRGGGYWLKWLPLPEM
jgi:DNA segregation ATPase FtsK/SpoIIIE, S-DNA-T family